MHGTNRGLELLFQLRFTGVAGPSSVATCLRLTPLVFQVCTASVVTTDSDAPLSAFDVTSRLYRV